MAPLDVINTYLLDEIIGGLKSAEIHSKSCPEGDRIRRQRGTSLGLTRQPCLCWVENDNYFDSLKEAMM